MTSNANHEPPYPFARRMSTPRPPHARSHRLEHRHRLQGKSGAQAQGRIEVTRHDDRHDIADEYMEVVYKLWEGSWEDDAVQRNVQTGVFADPARVNRIRHAGPHFQIDAVHLTEPSPQRTPLLFQAGSSARGKQSAGKHAECVYLSGPSKQVIAPTVAATRREAVRAGRQAQDILFFAMATIIRAAPEQEARGESCATTSAMPAARRRSLSSRAGRASTSEARP